ncbi:NADPH-dependent F420 reductase [Algoriphagus machipongonensis]|uniref:NADP oxidoreductase coenzyme F420-dependent superfamily n=1 Tax=Algoriphagus machipongonensis TaxID=388413 RepID=A3HS61_9BACT|nr:NAD(P)-binding domain-containing protein [Algoriphagus machipongonensis]EAZ82679.1 NADP oxidoreductase coenzyme F420-dependent superfamily [Algoriphagus machipongonensis]
MKLGILGGTNLSKTLGKKYLDAGLQVVFGVRTDFNTEATEWKILNRFYDKICPFESAIIQADIILICCENEQLDTVCENLEKVDLSNKLIIDCTNSNVASDQSISNTVKIQNSASNSLVFKAFNNLGLDYPNSDILGVVKETYFCGNGDLDRIRVKRLIELIGFKAIDAGKVDNAYLLEAFYQLSKEITVQKKESSNYHFKLISV